MSNTFIYICLWSIIYLAIFAFLDFYKKKYIDNKDKEQK